MAYKPVIFKLVETNNPFEVLSDFVRDWYEINLRFISYDYSDLFSVKLSNNVNKLLNFLVSLNCTTISGKKRLAYNAFGYIFNAQSFLIRYDEDLKFLIFLQEGKQDFYYGIPFEQLQEENPPIYRIVRNRNKEFIFFEDSKLIDFLVFHLCVNASKIGVKGYSMFLDEGEECLNKMEIFYRLFEHKTVFDKVIVLEKENAIATIKKGENIEDILWINKWVKDEKDFTKEIVDIFDWNGWSDNTGRYKL